MFCIVSANSSLECIAWGPFRTLAAAKKVKKRLEQVYPAPTHLILQFENIEVLKDKAPVAK